MVSINEIPIEQGSMLAACDKELLGQVFEEGELKLNVKEEFYGGEIVTIEIFEEKLKRAKIANLVGTNVVTKATELGLLDRGAVLEIAGVPHAQIANI